MQKTNNIEQKLTNLSENINIDRSFRLELRSKFLNNGDLLNSQSIASNYSQNPITLFVNNIFMKQTAILFGVGSVLLIVGASGVFALGAIPLVNSSKPGDLAYGIDRSFENIQLQLASLGGEKAVAETSLGFAQERVSEINAILIPNNATGLISKVYAQTDSEVIVDDADQETIDTLVDDYEDALNKAQDALDLLKGREPSSEQTKELANTLLETGEDLENTLVTIRGKVNGDTSFSIDDAVNLTVDFQGETFNVLYFDLKNENGEEHQALPEAKVENRVEKAKRELARINSLISKSEGKISEEALTQAKVIYAAAMEAVERGETSFKAGDMEGAYKEVDLAYELARQIKTYLRETAKDEKKAEREAAREVKRAERELEKAKRSGEDTEEAEEQLNDAKKAFKNKEYKKVKEFTNKARLNKKEKEVKKYKEVKEKKAKEKKDDKKGNK